MRLIILLAMGLFSLIGLATSKNVAGNVPSISIVGGTPAALGEFPFMAGLNLGFDFCGGVLISPSHVLTAGNCLYGKSQGSASTFTVRLNTLAYNGSTAGAVTRGVKKFILHPNFNPFNTLENDLTLLVLNQTVTNVSTIPLPLSATATTTKKPATTKKPKVMANGKTSQEPAVRLSGYAGMNAVIAGWGSTSIGGSISQKLLKANVTIEDNSVCTFQYGSVFNGKAMLCASAPGKGPCQGDTGGPIIVRGVLVGITIGSYGCADPDFAGIYVRITTYVNWIKTTMTNNPG